MNSLHLNNASFAACIQEIDGNPQEIQLFPCRPFRTKDGRPKYLDSWKINRGIAACLIGKTNSKVNPIVIDYEHQTLYSEINGKPAPAAGWFKSLEWREGKGLFAKDVVWTSTAKAYIEEKAYRYISPVFPYDPKSGEILDLFSAALTNNPAIDGMLPVGRIAALRYQLNEPPALSEADYEVCRKMNINTTSFAKTKALQGHGIEALKHVNPAGLSDAEVDIILKLGIKPENYIRNKTVNKPDLSFLY